MAKGKMVIARGLPGSGKSHRANELKKSCDQANIICMVCSTDDYWLRPDKTYDFNYDLISNANLWNQRRTRQCIWQLQPSIIIIDNVNVDWAEIKKYAQIAIETEYEVCLIESKTKWAFDVEECYKRNKHGVPYSTILRMYHSWIDSEDIVNMLLNKGCLISSDCEGFKC